MADQSNPFAARMKMGQDWARAVNPTQPVTSGVWLGGHKADPTKLIPMEKVQFEESDVISFHSYGKLDDVKTWVKNLRPYNRPLLCTEYMARPVGSTLRQLIGFRMHRKAINAGACMAIPTECEYI